MAEINTKPVSGKDWDVSLRQFPGSTFFDSAIWNNAFTYKVHEVHYLHFFIKRDLVAGLVAGVVYDADCIRVLTPYTAAVGGLLANTNISLKSYHRIVFCLIHYFEKIFSGKNFSIKYIQRPSLYSENLRYEVEEFCLLSNGFMLDDVGCELFIDVQSEKFISHQKTSYYQRKLHENEQVDFSPSTADEFCAFRDMAVAQQGKIKTVPTEEILQGQKLFPENILFWKLSHNRRPVAVLLEDRLSFRLSIGRNWFRDAEAQIKNVGFLLIHRWLEQLGKQGASLAGLGAGAHTATAFSEVPLVFKEQFHIARIGLRKTYKHSSY